MQVNPKLTPIEAELLEHAKKGQSVLLYNNNKDTIDRKELVLKIHILNGGTDSNLEYFDDKGDSVPREEYVRSIANFMISTEKDKLKTYHSRSTQRTWDYINCTGMTAREVYHELVEESTRIKREFDDYEATALERKLQSIEIMNSKKHTLGTLFTCNGMLFLDNLNVYEKTEITYYDKLAGIIQNKGIDYKITTFEWLVVYTHDLNNLPIYFREQFQEVNLEPESTPEKQKRKLPRGQKKPYADQKEYATFLQNINNKCNGTLSQKANMAISEMEGRRLFLNKNEKPIYTKSTIKRQLSELKKEPVLLSNLKSNGKVTKDSKVTKK